VTILKISLAVLHTKITAKVKQSISSPQNILPLSDFLSVFGDVGKGMQVTENTHIIITSYSLNDKVIEVWKHLEALKRNAIAGQIS
jgi:hypothetical protein